MQMCCVSVHWGSAALEARPRCGSKSQYGWRLSVVTHQPRYLLACTYLRLQRCDLCTSTCVN